jgi:hypothetical protein
LTCYQPVSNRVVMNWRVTYYKQEDPCEVNWNRLPLLRPAQWCENGRGRTFVSRAGVHISKRMRSCIMGLPGGAFSSIEHSRSVAILATTESKR